MKLSFCICFFLFPCFGESTISHPLFLSQAGAGGASLKEDSSFLLNPATIALQKKNKTILSYTFKQNQQRVFLSFSDLRTQVPLAISYQRDWTRSFIQSKNDTMFFSSGFPLSPHFALGITIEKDLKNTLWNGSLGSILKLGNQFSAALFLNDILKKENKNKRSLSLAFYHNWKGFFSTKIDVSTTAHQKWIYRGAIESLFQKFLSIRFGAAWYQKDRKSFFSGGIAFQSPKLLLEYSLETDQKVYQQAFTILFRI